MFSRGPVIGTIMDMPGFGHHYYVYFATTPEYDGGAHYRRDIRISDSAPLPSHLYEIGKALIELAKKAEYQKAKYDESQLGLESGTGTVGSDLRPSGPC